MSESVTPAPDFLIAEAVRAQDKLEEGARSLRVASDDLLRLHDEIAAGMLPKAEEVRGAVRALVRAAGDCSVGMLDSEDFFPGLSALAIEVRSGVTRTRYAALAWGARACSYVEQRLPEAWEAACEVAEGVSRGSTLVLMRALLLDSKVSRFLAEIRQQLAAQEGTPAEAGAPKEPKRGSRGWIVLQRLRGAAGEFVPTEELNALLEQHGLCDAKAAIKHLRGVLCWRGHIETAPRDSHLTGYRLME